MNATLLPPPAKFRQRRSKFGATKRRLNFSFNVYAASYVNASTSTVQQVIAGALSNWELIGGTAGVQVTKLAGLGFFAVRLSANVFTTYSNDEAARGLSDDLRRNFIVSNLTVNGGAPVTGGNTFPSQPTQIPSGSGTYVVQSGDTLSKIAARYGTTWQALAQLNGLTNPNALSVGQVLRVTGAPQPQMPAGTPTPPPVGTPLPPATPPPTGTPSQSTLESWAAKVGVSVSALVILMVIGAVVIKGKN